MVLSPSPFDIKRVVAAQSPGRHSLASEHLILTYSHVCHGFFSRILSVPRQGTYALPRAEMCLSGPTLNITSSRRSLMPPPRRPPGQVPRENESCCCFFSSLDKINVAVIITALEVRAATFFPSLIATFAQHSSWYTVSAQDVC